MKNCAFVLLFTIQSISAQTAEPVKLKYSLKQPHINVLTRSNALFLALSGPGVLVSNTKTEFALRFLATIRFDLKKDLLKPNESIRPLMGLGSQLKYKKIIITPLAFYFYSNKWEYAAGLGYTL